MGPGGYSRSRARGRDAIAYTDGNANSHGNNTSESDSDSYGNPYYHSTSEPESYTEQSGRFAYSDTHGDPDINTYRTTKGDTTASADSAFSAVRAR